MKKSHVKPVRKRKHPREMNNKQPREKKKTPKRRRKKSTKIERKKCVSIRCLGNRISVDREKFFQKGSEKIKMEIKECARGREREREKERVLKSYRQRG